MPQGHSTFFGVHNRNALQRWIPYAFSTTIFYHPPLYIYRARLPRDLLPWLSSAGHSSKTLHRPRKSISISSIVVSLYLKNNNKHSNTHPLSLSFNAAVLALIHLCRQACFITIQCQLCLFFALDAMNKMTVHVNNQMRPVFSWFHKIRWSYWIKRLQKP